MRKLLIGLVLALAMNSAAADISSDVIQAFNSSMQGGDEDSQIAAASNLAAEAMTNPEDEMAALLAYEAAWTLCNNDSCEAAIEPAEFARLQPSSDPAAHPIAADRELLVAYTNWKTKQSRRNRQSLDTALAAVVHGEPSLLSLTAFQERYLFDASKRRYSLTEATALEAATHFKLVEDSFPHLYVGAEMSAIVASFNDRPTADAQRRMAHFEGYLMQMRAPYEDKEEPSWMREAYFRANAWSLAMLAYFNSSSKRGAGSAEIEAILASYQENEAYTEATEHKQRDVAFCDGELIQRPRFNYPRGTANKGMIGAVIVGLQVIDGKAVNFEILASVPNEGFKESALETVSQWTWKVSEEQSVEPCNTTHENMVLPLLFQIQR